MKENTRAVFLFVVIIALVVAGCKKDDTTTGPPPGPTPITANLFPMIPGHQYVYVGYGIKTDGSAIPDPFHVYKTIWTIGPVVPSPLGGTATALIDTTTLQGPGGTVGKRTTLLIQKDSATGNVRFMQTLGPFFRAFGIARTDTLRWITVSDQSVGLGGTWTALDSSYTSGVGTIHLQILGKMEDSTTVTDSSAAHVVHHVYKTRTWRNIFVNGQAAVSNATTSEIWLEENVGPVQVHISQDTENIGHFRVLYFRNF